MQPCSHGSAIPGNEREAPMDISDDDEASPGDGRDSPHMTPPASMGPIQAKPWECTRHPSGQAQRDYEAAIDQAKGKVKREPGAGQAVEEVKLDAAYL
jgi:hypothetical protein